MTTEKEKSKNHADRCPIPPDGFVINFSLEINENDDENIPALYSFDC